MGKDIKSKTLFCSFILLFLLINPLFAEELGGFDVKDIVFFTLVIFIILIFILVIIKIINNVKETISIKEQINYLKKDEKKHKTFLYKKKESQRVKFSLTSKLIVLNAGLTIFVIILISYPLALFMIHTQEETLAAGLQRRITVLMDSISHGTKIYLPQKDILELNLLTSQVETIPEAQSITILSYPNKTEDKDQLTIDYVWASNDSNIVNKIDTSAIEFGISRYKNPDILLKSKSFFELEEELKKDVITESKQISELLTEYNKFSENSEIYSPIIKDELEILIKQLDSKLEVKLHNIASKNVNSYPTYNPHKIDRENTKYLFYYPILYTQYNDNTYLRGIIIVEVNSENLVVTLKNVQKEIFIMIFSIAGIALLIETMISLFFSIYMVKPIKELQKYVSMIKNSGTKYELLDKKVNIKTSDEIGLLSLNINEMTDDLIHASIYESMLLGGKEVQRAFLPLDTIDNASKVKLSVGHIETENVQFFGYYEGAKGVSGDFFDFKKLDEKYYAIIKCDVSGKGAPAALIMAEVSALFCDYFKNWSFEKDGINLHNLVYKINDHIEARNLKGKFAAFTLGIFDTFSGDIYFCNAGDNIIHIYNSVLKKLKTITLPSTPAAGIFPSFVIEEKGGYPTVKIHLKKNDVLFLYTDGIEDSKRFFRNDEGEILRYIPNTDKIIADKKDTNGIDGEEFGFNRVKGIIEAVFTKGKYRYFQKENPIKNDNKNIIFDFTNIEGTPEDAIMALVSVEKIFRLYSSSSAKSYDYGVADKKIDKFLQLYFNKYDMLFTKKAPHPNPDMKDEYLYYTEMKEEEQGDDLTLVAIKKK